MAGSEVKLSLRLLLASRQISCLHKSAASSAFQNTCFQSAPRINRHQSYHFRNHSTNSSQYPLIYNHGLISSWHTRFPKIDLQKRCLICITFTFIYCFCFCRSDSEACLFLRLRPGDLLEFDREVFETNTT